MSTWHRGTNSPPPRVPGPVPSSPPPAGPRGPCGALPARYAARLLLQSPPPSPATLARSGRHGAIAGRRPEHLAPPPQALAGARARERSSRLRRPPAAPLPPRRPAPPPRSGYFLSGRRRRLQESRRDPPPSRAACPNPRSGSWGSFFFTKSLDFYSICFCSRTRISTSVAPFWAYDISKSSPRHVHHFIPLHNLHLRSSSYPKCC